MAAFDIFADFISSLKKSDIPVSVVEEIELAKALGIIDIASRLELKYTLMSTLIKSSAHIEVFESLFQKYFALWQPVDSENLLELSLRQDVEDTFYRSYLGDNRDHADSISGGRMSHSERLDIGHTELEAAKQILLEALLKGSEREVALLAKTLAAYLLRAEPGKLISPAYYMSLFSRILGVREMKDLLLSAVPALAGGRLPTAENAVLAPAFSALPEKRIRELSELAQLGDLGALLIARDLENILAKFMSLLNAEIANVIAAVINEGETPLPKTVGNFEFLRADEKELSLMRKELKPLAKILASRLKKVSHSGKYTKVNFHSTFRKSLATQGVPFDILYKKVNVAKPEITVIADVSGSVASFARFSLHLISAIADEFDKVNSFVFIDEILDMTRELKGRKDPALIEDFITRAAAVSIKGHSDYGYALQAFADRHMKNVLNLRTTVILLGDARTNYHPPRPDLLALIKKHSKNLYFINPEPKRYWNTGDSAMTVISGLATLTFLYKISNGTP